MTTHANSTINTETRAVAEAIWDKRAAGEHRSRPWLCDWCRSAEQTPEHLAGCPDHLAWILNPGERVLREYWYPDGGLANARVTRVLGRIYLVPARAPQGSWQGQPAKIVVFAVKAANSPRGAHAGYPAGQGPADDEQEIGEVGVGCYNREADARAAAIGFLRPQVEALARRVKFLETGPVAVRKYPAGVEARVVHRGAR